MPKSDFIPRVKETTVPEELNGRIQTIEREIDRQKADAKDHREQAEVAEANVKSLETLAAHYRKTLALVEFASSDPKVSVSGEIKLASSAESLARAQARLRDALANVI